MPSITGGIVLVSSRILLPVDLATVRAGVSVSIRPTTPVYATASATIYGGSGRLFGVIAASEVSAGTLLLLHAGGSRLIQMIVPANDTRIVTTPNGIIFTGSLIASIMGTMSVTFML
ncbi:MAG: hypothetical protein QXE50_05970 [Nitrososphaerota archaeon]